MSQKKGPTPVWTYHHFSFPQNLETTTEPYPKINHWDCNLGFESILNQSCHLVSPCFSLDFDNYLDDYFLMCLAMAWFAKQLAEIGPKSS